MSDPVPALPVEYAELARQLRAFAAGCRGSMWQSRDETIRLCDESGSAITTLSARIEALEAELRATDCPCPANGRPDDFTVGQCVDVDECGCRHGSPLMSPEQHTARQRAENSLLLEVPYG